ncbi:lysoplasmalogenase family protein [Pseudomonas sp. GCM10022186]|uniref:lysoplasmalogenase family protein n=1 Tax=Pseudomonas sp. GCM10022186 TaxID=3252650 RepID=UPI00360E4D51
MLWRAPARLGVGSDRQSALMTAGAAALFVRSESLIGIDRFVIPFNGANYFIILSYRLGQWAIATSAMAFPGTAPARKNPSAPSREIGYSN